MASKFRAGQLYQSSLTSLSCLLALVCIVRAVGGGGGGAGAGAGGHRGCRFVMVAADQ